MVPPITEGDLTGLPPIVRHYLRGTGVVGQPRVQNMRLTMHGRIRSGPDAGWMPFSAEQVNVFGERSRLFYMKASKLLMPIQVFHRYVRGSASMTVRALGILPIASASGPAMTQAETVTLLNDMCIFAPATLIDPSIEWQSVGELAARATFSNAGHTIHAELVFDHRGRLTNFWSDDRLQAQPNGQLTAMRWSTPVWKYCRYGSVLIASRGQGRWHDAGGDYAYIETQLDDVEYNVSLNKSEVRSQKSEVSEKAQIKNKLAKAASF